MHTTLESPVPAIDLSFHVNGHARVSHMAEGLIGSEILKIAADIRTMTAAGAQVCNLTVGDFDPKLAEITDNVLFGDVWERPGLAKRDRSLITVAALIALNRPEQLRHHLQRARDNGVTKDEVVEVITQMAFYTGWPNAINAIPIARETFK